MGISGLLPFVKPASTEKHIKEFKGQTAAIDSYCWLHKGAFGCADKLAMGEKTDGYIHYCFKYIDMLLTFKVKPIMVFDGQHLPAKLLTEKKRRESRNQARKRATECLKLGNMIEARNNFRRCVDITPEMAFEFIKECRRRNIDCIVAPYEADAQLAYLNQTKIADFVISEDSDLLTFGCSKVLFKLDLTGRGTLVEADKLHLATKDRPDTYSFDKFRQMCILSGCDYLESLPGIGLKKALKFIKAMTNDDIYNNMVQLPKILNMTSLVVTKEYRDQFMIADATFRHQLVFDVVQKKLVPLTDPEKCGTNLEYCCNSGKMLDSELAYQIAVGNYNPFNHEEFSNWTPQQSNFSSIWCRSSYANSKPMTSILSKPTANILKVETKHSNKKINNYFVQEAPVDDKIEEKLIMMYSVKKIEQKIEPIEEIDEPPAKKICLREVKNEESPSPNKSDEMSPTLTGRKQFINPFLRKSQANLLNKFTETTPIKTEEKTVVSKYFSSETTENNSTVLETNECCSVTKETKQEPSDSEEEEQLSSSLKENEISPNIESSSKQMSPNIESSKMSPRNKSSPKRNGINIEVIKLETLTTKLEVKTQNIMKCRPQGLSRNNNKNNNKFKASKSQPTLLSMFAFTKK